MARLIGMKADFTGKGTTSERGWGLFNRATLFFIFFYLYVCIYLDPRLMYHGYSGFTQFPVFSVGWSFFKEFAGHPGGLTEYAAAFLSQYYYFSWIGALIITTIGWLVCRCTNALIIIAGGTRSRVICYVPALLLLIMYNRYGHPLAICVALLTALWLSVVYERTSHRIGTKRVILFLLMFVVLYYIAGGASLLFVVLATGYEVFFQKQLRFGGLYLLMGLVVPWLAGTYAFGLEMAHAYLCLLGFQRGMDYWVAGSVRCLYLFFPVVIMSVMLWHNLLKGKLSSRGTKTRNRSKSVDRKKIWTILESRRFKAAIRPTVLTAITILSILFSFDVRKKNFLQMTFFSRHNMWAEVLKLAQQVPSESYDFFNIHDVDRALYHTGRLGYEMFSFPQDPDALLPFKIPLWQSDLLGYAKTMDVFMEIGDLNLAEKMIYELLENQGPRPFLLERLAMINIVKGQVETASIFLNRQSKDLIYGDEAKDILQRLSSNPQQAGDSKVEHLRSIMWLKDYAVSQYDAETLLQELLWRNKNNRMAFEYLMAYYLLTRQLDKIVANIERLDDFGYEEIPCHYEEAILLYTNVTKEKVDLADRQLSRETVQRFNLFYRINKTCRRYNYTREGFRKAMVGDFGRSYFFYYAFGESGAEK